jgi:hypothetical protein
MPTVLRLGPYRFYFYSHESNEPAHIHVDRDNLSEKFWLELVQLDRNIGFSASDLRKLEQMIVDHHEELQEKWNGYFIIER